MLLSNVQVQAYLKENAVMAWESVGPVPQVTIDFGNGKTLKRTLGGNTVISVLLPDGRAVDALPGVYTPDDFLAQMRQTGDLLRGFGGAVKAQERPNEIVAWHASRASLSGGFGGRVGFTASKSGIESGMLRRLNAAPVQQLTLQGGQGTPWSGPAVTPVPNPFADAFRRASANLVDVSKQGAEPEEVRRRFLTDHEHSGADPMPDAAELGRRAVEADSRVNVASVRPVVHLYFASREQGRLPEARACRDELYERVLHVPVGDPYLGLANVLVPGTPPGSGR